MKKNSRHYRGLTIHHYQPVYPNAADAAYFTGKALNIVTALVSGMGLVSAMVFLVTLA